MKSGIKALLVDLVVTAKFVCRIPFRFTPHSAIEIIPKLNYDNHFIR